MYHNMLKSSNNCIDDLFALLDSNEESSDTIAIVDFLNLSRSLICERVDAKFNSLDEFILIIGKIANQLRAINDFSCIYIVTKSFNLNDDVKYFDIPKIIIWTFCKAVPEWEHRINVVLVNGINDNDKEADDRSLFILYSQYALTTTDNVIILSNDNFDSLKNQIVRPVTLNFCRALDIKNDWKTSIISYPFCGQFQLNEDNNKQYKIVSLFDNNVKNIIVF